MNAVRVKILKEGAKLPTYGSAQAAGADLYACLEEDVTIAPGETAFIPTGFAMAVPKGCAGLIYARSGMACKRGLAPANKVGVVDSDYRGEIIVALVEDSATVKRFYKEDGHFRLQPENDDYEPIIVDSVEILGKVVSVMRSYD